MDFCLLFLPPLPFPDQKQNNNGQFLSQTIRRLTQPFRMPTKGKWKSFPPFWHSGAMKWLLSMPAGRHRWKRWKPNWLPCAKKTRPCETNRPLHQLPFCLKSMTQKKMPEASQGVDKADTLLFILLSLPAKYLRFLPKPHCSPPLMPKAPMDPLASRQQFLRQGKPIFLCRCPQNDLGTIIPAVTKSLYSCFQHWFHPLFPIL